MLRIILFFFLLLLLLLLRNETTIHTEIPHVTPPHARETPVAAAAAARRYNHRAADMFLSVSYTSYITTILRKSRVSAATATDD